jgi:hypothetical protein
MSDAPSAGALTKAPADPSKGSLRILQLYPREMNIYGDYGNVLVLKQRSSSTTPGTPSRTTST